MRNTCTFLFAVLTCFATQSLAQNWSPRNTGLPASFKPGTVYGKGSSIIVTQRFGTPQVFYMTDMSAPFVATTSVLSASGYMTSYIVSTGGTEYAGNTYNIFKSTDNGHTWGPTGFASAAFALYAYNDTLYAGDGTGTHWPKMSANGGATWTSIPFAGGLPQTFLKANGILYLGSTAGVYSTTNNGSSWTPRASGNIFCMATLDGNLYAAGNTGVLKSTDGVTWTSVFSGNVTAICAVDTSLFIGTDENGVYRSNKAGTSWVSMSMGLPYTGATHTSIVQISFNNNYIIAAVDDNDAVYVTNRDGTPTPPPPTSVNNVSSSKNGLDFTMTPNPATNEVLIETNNASADKVSVSIYDMAGRSIKSMTATTKNISVSLNEIPAGTYLVHVDQGSEHSVKKLVVTK